VTLVDTGELTGTGGRLKKVADYIRKDELFCLTYGDGVSDVDITASIAFHRSHGELATLTAVQPTARFGLLDIENDQVQTFREKEIGEGGWVNGGFFVLSPKVLDFISDDPATMWEREPLQQLTDEGHLFAYRHRGYWQPMDTLRDKQLLDELWASGRAPWKTW
jgi:glucose-1-phosphate cytidylyltransferase